MINNNKSSSRPIHQQGFTLVELMISIVLGLLVIAAATAIFLSGQRSLNMQTGMSELQQNSIFGLTQIAHDLRHINLNTTVDQKITSLATGSGIVFNASNLPGLPANMGTKQNAQATNMSVSSDQLTIQYKPTVHGGATSTGLVNCEGDALNDEAVVNVQRYYIQANNTANGTRYNLMCDAWYPSPKNTNRTTALGRGAVVVLQDVEAFKVRFAVKTAAGVAYKSIAALLPTEQIIAVEIGLVARSSSSVGSGNHIDATKSFNIAGTNVALTSPAGQDRFLREAFSQVVAIRNGQGGI